VLVIGSWHPDEVRTHTIYAPNDRPEAEVLVDGVWYSAEVRSWMIDDAGDWWASCSWSKGPGDNYLDTVPAARVRQAGGPDVTG